MKPLLHRVAGLPEHCNAVDTVLYGGATQELAQAVLQVYGEMVGVADSD